MPVVDAGQVDGQYYIASRYIPGERLTDRLANQQQVSHAETILPIVTQLADALDYAHEQGIEHKGLTTDNIILTEDGQVMITDFCLAEGLNTVALTDQDKPASFAAHFLAPEQIRADIESDSRADIYSLGVVAYSMLTRNLPFVADTQGQLLYAIVNDIPHSARSLNPSIPAGGAYVLRNVLAKEPDVRYSTAGDFQNALSAGMVWDAPVAEKQQETTNNGRRRLIGALATLVMLLLVAGGVYLFLIQPALLRRGAVVSADRGANTASATPPQNEGATSVAAAQAEETSQNAGADNAEEQASNRGTNTPESPAGGDSENESATATDPATATAASVAEDAGAGDGGTATPTTEAGPTATPTAASTATAQQSDVNEAGNETAESEEAASAIIAPATQRTAQEEVTATNTPEPTATNTARPTSTNTAQPTVTNTPRSTSTNTAQPTATNTAQPTSTNTPQPTATNTPRPTSTNTALPTATNTAQPTATNTPQPTATNTPRPTSTNTALPTATNTSLPTATRTPIPLPTATYTPQPTATNTVQPTVTNTPLPLPTATSTRIATGSSALQLLLPLSGGSGTGSQLFSWDTTITPQAGQAFEIVFWQDGQDPITQGFGMAAPTTGNQVSIDLTALDNSGNHPLEPGEYQWGLLLVQVEPSYQRLQFMDAQSAFRFYRAGSGSSGGDPGGPPSTGE
ncbi:MAG: protein kinase [Caldilineaceae bacterium]|nr:protein kinase [Caldilineaceae bacterium]